MTGWTKDKTHRHHQATANRLPSPVPDRPEQLRLPLVDFFKFGVRVKTTPTLLLWGHDGVVSCLRAYNCDELEAMVARLDDPGYHWDIGVHGKEPFEVTYLIGCPPSGGEDS
jgi:hypothetical protein